MTKLKNSFCLTFLFLSLLISRNNYVESERVECLKKQYSGVDSFVCVCNSKTCDTVEPIDGNDKETSYQEWISCADGYRLDKFKSAFNTSAAKDSQLILTLNRTKTYQSIVGFGGAITDAAGFNIYSLSADLIDKFVKSYFDANGIEYGVLRVPLAGVDFSTRKYTYDEVPGDFNLTKFSLSDEDIKWKIPFVQAAMKASQKNLKMFGSAWTAPPWMKTNNDYKGNGTLIGPPGGIYYQTWADYYLKFLQAYKQAGINFWGLTAQNEPSDGFLYKFGFNAMGFTPETQSQFVVDNLGPTLEQNGFNNVKIMILDDQRLFLPAWPQRVFAFSPKAAKYVSGIAVHWYLDSVVDPKLLDQTHEMFPDKFLFGTEACTGAGPLVQHVILGSFRRAESYAKDIIEDLNHWMTGWTDWNLALDTNGGPNWANNFVDGPVIVNATANEFYKQPLFYAMGHFSKFIPENSVRVDLNVEAGSDLKKVRHVAFKNDQLRQTILVLLNQGDVPVTYSIYDAQSNKYINSESAPHSIRTLVWYY